MAGASAASGFNTSIVVMIVGVLALGGFALYQIVRFARQADAADLEAEQAGSRVA